MITQAAAHAAVPADEEVHGGITIGLAEEMAMEVCEWGRMCGCSVAALSVDTRD